MFVIICYRMALKRSRVMYYGSTYGDESRPNTFNDPLAGYYASNEQFVQQNAIIQKVLTFLKMKLFSDGIVFVKNNEILVPPDWLQTNVSHYWIPFMHKSLAFIFAHGYLVFRIYENDKGHLVPDIPDFELLTVRKDYNKKTAAPEIEVEWKDEAYRRNVLYVINCQSPFGITPANPMAPVDIVKEWVLEYMQLVENKYVANYHNARPPMILQHPVIKASGDPGNNDLNNYDDILESKMLENMETIGKDELNLQRIRNVARIEKATFQAGGSSISGGGLPTPWWIKAYARQMERPESRFMYVPHGLSYTAGPSASSDGDYVNIQTSLLEKIYNAFGIPYSAILTSSARQTATGLELHKTTLINTLKTYWTLYEIILTDVYRLMFDFTDGDVDIDQGEPVKKNKKTKVKDKDEDDDNEALATEKELFKKDKDSLVKVFLKSQFQTTPEQAMALYHEGVVSFKIFQALRLESVGLPVFLADTTVPPPIRTQAMDIGLTMKLNENAKAVQANK